MNSVLCSRAKMQIRCSTNIVPAARVQWLDLWNADLLCDHDYTVPLRFITINPGQSCSGALESEP